MQTGFRRSLLSLSALVVALMPLSTALQAQPQTQPQARRNYPAQTEFQANQVNRLAMFEGLVTARLDNNEFEMRVGGATFRVRNAYRITVRNGDRVMVRGTFRNNEIFDAQSVRPIGAGTSNSDDFGFGNPYNIVQNVDFPGVVTGVVSRREIEVRGDNNRFYRVILVQEINVLRLGTRLRVRGELDGTRISNGRLLIQGIAGSGYYPGNGNYGGNPFGGNGTYGVYSGNDGSYNPGFGRPVDFPGRVLRLDANRNEATVRGDNGRDYIVRGAEVDKFRAGDRVRVRGQASGDVIELDRLDLVI